MSFKNIPSRVDVLIIGGGVAGCAVARDACLRGLHVMLCEQNTLASGTSSKSSRLIHGGIRYLELSWKSMRRGDLKNAWKNFRFVFSSLRESSLLARLSPDIITPIELYIPISERSDIPRFFFFAGALLYGLLGMINGFKKMPRLYLNRSDFTKACPILQNYPCRGGAVVWDHQTDDKKLVNRLAENARQNGAIIVEHARIESVARDSQNQYQIQIIDGKSSSFAHVTATSVVNASGPWMDKLNQELGLNVPALIRPVGGSHIQVRKFSDHSLILRADDNRTFFAINIGDECRVGTTEFPAVSPTPETPDSDIDYLLKCLNAYFPDREFSRQSILSADAGVRPLALDLGISSAHETSREHHVYIDKQGIFHLCGVKLTDHRRAAKDLLDKLIQHQGLTANLCQTHIKPF